MQIAQEQKNKKELKFLINFIYIYHAILKWKLQRGNEHMASQLFCELENPLIIAKNSNKNQYSRLK